MVGPTVLARGSPAVLQVPAVAAEPRVKFLKGFPKVGGYCAVAVPAGPSGPSSGEQLRATAALA